MVESIALFSGEIIVIVGRYSSNQSGDKSENSKRRWTGDYWIVRLK